MKPLVTDLVDAHAEGARTVAGVGADQWGLPTPCEGWDVATLVRHQVVGHRVFETLLRGGTVERPGDMERWDAELREHDPAELPTLFVESARDLERAFDEADDDVVVRLPIGEVSWAEALHLRLAEVFAHGWDLARATGQNPHFDDQVVEREIAEARDLLPRMPTDRVVFGAPLDVADDAPALDRLAALLGRR